MPQGLQALSSSCSTKFTLNDAISYFQTERAFQKQLGVFLNKKRPVDKSKAVKTPRYVKTVGLGFKTPREVCTGPAKPGVNNVVATPSNN